MILTEGMGAVPLFSATGLIDLYKLFWISPFYNKCSDKEEEVMVKRILNDLFLLFLQK